MHNKDDSFRTRNNVRSCYANPNDEAGFLTQVAVIADLHLDPLPGGFKPDTRYIRASRA